MMVGSYFFLSHKSDWNHLSIYTNMVEYHEKKFLNNEGGDLPEKLEALEKYVDELEQQL